MYNETNLKHRNSEAHLSLAIVDFYDCYDDGTD